MLLLVITLYIVIALVVMGVGIKALSNEIKTDPVVGVSILIVGTLFWPVLLLVALGLDIAKGN